jgi:hypothetical protein
MVDYWRNILSAYLSIYLSVYVSTALCWTLTAFSVSLSFTQSIRFLGRGISPSQGYTVDSTQTSMPQEEFEPTSPVFERH